MKAKYILISTLIGIVTTVTSCSDGFESLNTDPNRPDNVEYHKSDLTTALRAGATLDGAHLHQRIKNINIDAFAQYFDSGLRNYVPQDSYNSDYWGSHYRWSLLLNNVIELTKNDESKRNYLAVARIWRVYIQSQAADFFGPIPLQLSTSGENVPYKSLEEQYKFFFNELADASSLLSPSKDFLGTPDNIYWGQIEKWQRFANSLHLRLAMRLSEIDPSLCKAEIKRALGGGGLLQSSADDARIGSSTGWGNQYNYYMYQVTWGGKLLMMSSMEKALANIGGIAYQGTAENAPANVDPRGERYFQKSVDGSFWRGMRPGLRSTDGVEYSERATRNAFLSEKWVVPDNTRKQDILIYPEVCFLLAEAVERGFASAGDAGGTAKEWYEKGVVAAFERWQLAGTLATDTYLKSNAPNTWGTTANYDYNNGAGDTKLEKIITQKYIASFPDLALEAWNDKRRLNLPAFDVPLYRDAGAGTFPNTLDIKDPSNFISRMIFPQNEALINEKEYRLGVQLLGAGGDKTSTPLWWASLRKNYCTSVNP